MEVMKVIKVMKEGVNQPKKKVIKKRGRWRENTEIHEMMINKKI